MDSATLAALDATPCETHGCHPRGYLCAEQAAQFLSVSRKTLWRWERDPELKALLKRRQIHAKLCLYRRVDLINLIEIVGVKITDDIPPDKSVSHKTQTGNTKSRRISHANS